jgi:hypothetical protein
VEKGKRGKIHRVAYHRGTHRAKKSTIVNNKVGKIRVISKKIIKPAMKNLNRTNRKCPIKIAMIEKGMMDTIFYFILYQ